MKMQNTSTATSVAFAAAMGLSAAAMAAVDATYTGPAGTQSYDTPANWTPGVPGLSGNTNDTATINDVAANLTLQLNGATPTLKSVLFNDSNSELQLQTGTGGFLTFATTDATTPTLNSVRTSGNSLFLYADVRGTQGLTLSAGGAGAIFRTNAASNFANLSGTFTLAQGTLDPQAGSSGNGAVLPFTRFALGTAGTASLQVISGRNQTLASLSGTSTAFVANTTTAVSTLTLGDLTTDAVYAGAVGRRSDFTVATPTFGINLIKRSAGTQTISGNVYNDALTVASRSAVTLNADGGTLVLGGNNTYRGTTTVNANSTLIFTGTHTPAAETDTVAGTILGAYNVQAGGMLRGTGTITPRVDNVVGGGVAVSIRGTLNPGLSGSDFGALNLDGINSVKSVLIDESTGTFAFDVGSSGGDRINVANAAVADVRFSGGSTIAVNDLSGGALTGSVLLINTDRSTNDVFGGLTFDANGFVTAGVMLTGTQTYADASLQAVEGDLYLVVPEPAALGLLGIGALGLLSRRRANAI
ncbi:MAG TPA: PEP-CTERM sorting domain-containing protein [Tepidisphaeraceae bacterium]|jgi:autotransporter-associated beta strand protein